MAEAQRENVRQCAAALEARIAPFVAAALAGADVDAAAQALAREAFEASIEAEAARLRRCSMGPQMLSAIGYSFVRQALKLRGKHAQGAERIGGLYEGVLHGVHNMKEGALGVGSAVGMASDAWKLARDARPETPIEKRLSDSQRAELEERVKRRTMELAWRITKRQIERTARATVDEVIDRAYAGDSTSADEQRARGDAIILIGNLFSGEKAHAAVDKAVDGLNKLATHASEAKSKAKSNDISLRRCSSSSSRGSGGRQTARASVDGRGTTSLLS